MTPHRSHGVGTLYLDRRFAKVLGRGPQARICVASGTNDPKLLTRLNVMLSIFAERRPELLEEIRDQRLTPLQAYRYFSTGEWERIPVGKHLRPLLDTAEAWARARRKKLAESTRAERIRWVESVLRAYAKPGATLDALPAILEAYRDDCEDEDTASAWNHARSYARAFLRDTLKRSDRLYAAVKDMDPLEETPKVGRNPQTPAAARAIAEQLGPEAGAIWLSLCYTGMNLKEFYEDGWQVEFELEAVRVHGRKRRARERLVPLLVVPVVPKIRRQGFRSVLRRAKLGVTPHDARRSYAAWLIEAGVDPHRRDYYRGHKPQTMEGLYAQPGSAIKDLLREDGKKLRAYLGLGEPGLKVETA